MKRTCADVDDRGRLLRSVRTTGHGLRLDVQAPGRVRIVARHSGRTYVRRLAVRGGARRVALRLPADGRWSVRLQTRTGWYVRWATERRFVHRAG